MKYFFSVLIILMQVKIYAQFEEKTDKILNQKTITYSNNKANIIFQKWIDLSGDSSHIELGLVIVRNSVGSFDFMNNASYIVFEDGSSIIFQKPATLALESAGKNYFSIKHILSSAEEKILQMKKIDYFKLNGYKYTVDRWEKVEILNNFNKLLME